MCLRRCFCRRLALDSVKKIHAHPLGLASTTPCGPERNQKKKKKRRQGKFPPSHLELGYPYFLPQILELWVLGPSDSGTYTSGPLLSRPLASDWELHHQLLGFSVLLISTGLYPLDFLVL